jgi:hypothetical protein
MNLPPKALISYSWDSDDHKSWVRGFAERLRLNGVDVRLDQWHVDPGQSLTQFMEVEIVTCDYVLIVCTPNYYTKSLTRKGGVGYEQQIISGYLAAGQARGKFIPVVRKGNFEPGDNCAVPPHFAGILAVDLRDDTMAEHGQEQVLRAIFKVPLYEPPPIGERPQWGTIAVLVDEIEELRLATLDLDGWELNSGLAQHHRTPETFYMPSEKERRTLVEGDIVKLIFNISIPPDEDDPDAPQTFGERMWVIVQRRVGPYYVGELNNNPVTSDEQDKLYAGSEVIFLPEHVIDIED